MSKKNILILDGSSSQALPLIRAFRKSGYHITIIIPHRFCSGSLSRYVNKTIKFPISANFDNSLEWLKKYLSDGKTDLILGLSDKTAWFLSENKKELSRFTQIIAPDFDVFSIAADKQKTMQFCMKNRIPCPYTIDDGNLNIQEIETQIQFPVIIKPKIGVGSMGVFRYDEANSLKKDYLVKRDVYGPLIIQEYVPNEKQYTVEVFCDSESDLKACVVVEKSRYYPIKGGTSSCNVTVKSAEIVSIVSYFLKKLKWVGSANLDVIWDPRDNTPKIIEINPRTGAMIRIAFEAGVDIAELTLQLAFKNEVSNSLDYKEGVVLRNLPLETFWLFSSPLKHWFQTKPSFLNVFGRKIFLENTRLDDPLTGIGYVLGLLIKFCNIKNLKSKFSRRD